MKRTSIITVVLGLILTGCGEKSKSAATATNNASSGGSVITAPVDYLNAAGKAEQRAVGTVDTIAVTQAIQLFYTDKGRFPRDLDELVTEKYVAKLPELPYGTKFEYDATTGNVKVVKR